MMRVNLENWLRNERVPKYMADQLISHLLEMRDRCIKGEMHAVVNEFFDLYRFSDNQQSDDWRKVSDYSGYAKCEGVSFPGYVFDPVLDEGEPHFGDSSDLDKNLEGENA